MSQPTDAELFARYGVPDHVPRVWPKRTFVVPDHLLRASNVALAAQRDELKIANLVLCFATNTAGADIRVLRRKLRAWRALAIAAGIVIAARVLLWWS